MGAVRRGWSEKVGLLVIAVRAKTDKKKNQEKQTFNKTAPIH